MKNVDVIFSCSLKSSIGPTGTIRRIIKNKPYFLENGYNIEVFTIDNLTNEQTIGINVKSSRLSKVNIIAEKFLKKLIKPLISILKSDPAKRKIAGVLMLLSQYLVSRKIVKYYIKSNREPQIIVFHSLFDCYQVLRSRNKDRNSNTTKYALFFHSDGIPFKMDLIYFPKLKNTIYHRKLIKIVKYIINNIDQFVFIANIGKSNFLEEYPFVDRSKISVVRNGIDDLSEKEQIELSTMSKLNVYKYELCCVGTICERKGQRIILEALNRMDKSVLRNIHVSFLGDGPEMAQLETFVFNNNLVENVSFLGNIDNTQVFKYLQQSDIYILTSINEGLPISILEALRAGLPIISTTVSGIPELVDDGLNGILIEPDVAQLINILNNIDNYDWKSFGINSRKKFIQSFTFDRMKNDYCKMLNKLSEI